MEEKQVDKQEIISKVIEEPENKKCFECCLLLLLQNFYLKKRLSSSKLSISPIRNIPMPRLL